MDENTIGPATMTTSTHKTKVSRIFHMDEKYAVGVKINPSETILIKKSSKKYPATRALAASKKNWCGFTSVTGSAPRTAAIDTTTNKYEILSYHFFDNHRCNICRSLFSRGIAPRDLFVKYAGNA